MWIIEHARARVPGANLEHGVKADEVGSRSAPDFGAGWRRLTTVRRAWRRMVQCRHGPAVISSAGPRGRHDRPSSRPRRSRCLPLPWPVPTTRFPASGRGRASCRGTRRSYVGRRRCVRDGRRAATLASDSPVAAASYAHSAYVLKQPPPRRESNQRGAPGRTPHRWEPVG